MASNVTRTEEVEVLMKEQFVDSKQNGSVQTDDSIPSLPYKHTLTPPPQVDQAAYKRDLFMFTVFFDFSQDTTMLRYEYDSHVQ
jgi:hypothetical protein